MRSITLQEEELDEIKRREREKATKETANTIISIIKNSIYYTPYGIEVLTKEIKRKLKI